MKLSYFLLVAFGTTNSKLLENDEAQVIDERPNIVFIFTDDQGFNDVPWKSRLCKVI